MATINSIVDSVGLELGEQVTDPDILELFQTAVRDSIEEFHMEVEWPWSRIKDVITTVTSQATYTLSDGDVAEIRFIFDTTNNQKFKFIELDELIQGGYDLTAEGTALYWYMDSYSAGEPTIGLWKVPDDATTSITVYSLRHYGTLTVSETLNIPNDAVLAVKALTKHRILLNSEISAQPGQRDDAQQEYARYMDLLKKLRKRHQDQIGVERVHEWGDVNYQFSRLNVPNTIPTS